MTGGGDLPFNEVRVIVPVFALAVSSQTADRYGSVTPPVNGPVTPQSPSHHRRTVTVISTSPLIRRRSFSLAPPPGFPSMASPALFPGRRPLVTANGSYCTP